MRPSPCTPTDRTSPSSTTGHCQISRSSPAADSSSRAIASASRSTSRRSAVTSPMMRIPRPGPGNGCRQTIASGRPSSRPTRRTSSLNSARSGSTSENCEVVGQPADVVVRLDVGRAGAAPRLDDVGIERALHEELDRLAVRARGGDDVARRLLEHPDELAADRLALLLGVGDAGERVEEALGCVGHDELHAGGLDDSRARPARPRPCAAARGRRTRTSAGRRRRDAPGPPRRRSRRRPTGRR